jgi:hypothetical protein
VADAGKRHGLIVGTSGVLQVQPGLLEAYPWEQLDEFSQGDAVFQIFKQSRYWNPGTAEHPGAAHALRIAFHSTAACPAQIGLRGHGPQGGRTHER